MDDFEFGRGKVGDVAAFKGISNALISFHWTTGEPVGLKELQRLDGDQLRKLILADEDILLDIKGAQLLAEDFYTAWSLSSTEVINKFGLDLTRDFLLFCRKYFFILWSSSDQQWAEDCGFTEDHFTVYRGASMQEVNSGKYGFSWTLSQEVAESYAAGRGGQVIEQSVTFDDIAFAAMEEMEIIIFPKD